MNRRYVLISPCRDEAAFMRRTLDAVARQTVLPALWVIVDDGSTDGTPEILRDYAARLPWLRIVTRADRGRRAVGPGVIEAFYAGLETVDLDDFEYLCKLDLDLDFHPRYFQLLIERMVAEPRLGTFSGKPWVQIDGQLMPEPCGDEMSVGMSKFYRTACFRQIGGFVREVMWDGIDCHRARLLGWLAGSSDAEPELHLHHLRPMGSSQTGIHTGRRRHGSGQWFMGTGLLYMAASSVFRMRHPPYVSGGLSMLRGYADAARQHAPRYGDERFRRFLRRYQWLMLTRGKRAATRAIGEEQAWAFDPQRAPAALGANPVPEFAQHLELPRHTRGGLQLHLLSPDEAVTALCREIGAQRGGWLQVFDPAGRARYLRDAAFAQLVQGVSLSLASADGLIAALAASKSPVLCLVDSTAVAGAITAAIGAEASARMTPPWSWAEREPALAVARKALHATAPGLVLTALESPQQEWLITRLRREFPDAGFVAIGRGIR